MRFCAALVGAILLTAGPAGAEGEAARCTRRIAQTLGLDWRALYHDLQPGETPESKVAEWLESRIAIRTLASFINSRFNTQPATNSYEDAVYSAAVYVLTNKLPWSELYTGRLRIDGTNGQVFADPNARALGYFGSKDWQFRYKGNEPNGVMLSAAYRTMQNTIGLKLIPSPINGQGDASATGRERADCRGCHYDSAYALDKVARLLPKRVGFGGGAKIEIVPVAPQTLFGGTVDSYEALVARLVHSEAFVFWTCRLAFEFVFGRPESACEGPIFDRCTQAFEASGSMAAAVQSLLVAPEYCAATEDRP
jgi:hypothetical protein